MFSRGNTNLTKRKTGELTNSTKTCRIELNQVTGLFDKAYSYGEVIAKVDHKEKVIVLNDHNFSNTTNSHQSAVRYKLSELYKDYKKFTVDVTTLNYFDFKTLSSLTDKIYNHTDGLEKLVEVYFTKKTALKVGEAAKKITADREESNRQSRNKAARVKRLTENLETLNYKTEKAFIKALEKYKSERPGRGYDLYIRTSWENFEKFQKIIESENIFMVKHFKQSTLEMLGASPETLQKIVNELGDFHFSLNRYSFDMVKINDYIDFLETNRERFSQSYSSVLETVDALINNKKARQVFGTLDNNQEAV
jgi:hypothetical protein